MAVIFISYGDENFKESLIRIKRQAKKLDCFDRIITYHPKDLPLQVKSSPLMAFRRGGGYWVWKPYIIYKTLMDCQEGDIVVYVDSGCTLRKGAGWNEYFELLKTYNALFFQYRSDYDYGWGERFNVNPQDASPQILHWMKPSCYDYFRQCFGSDEFKMFNKIWAGFIVVKKTQVISEFIEDWCKITLFHPDLVIDPLNVEREKMPDSFRAHRHDQPILTCLAHHYQEKGNILVLPENGESDTKHAVVSADRYRVGRLSFMDYLKYKIYQFIHKD